MSIPSGSSALPGGNSESRASTPAATMARPGHRARNRGGHEIPGLTVDSARARAMMPRHGRDRDAARDLRDPRVLPHQPDADLLRLADGVQPARHRPLAAELLLRQLLRLVRGQPSARVRPAGPPVRRVRVDGGRLQLPARAQGGARAGGEERAGRQGRIRHVRRRDRGGRGGGRAGDRPPVGRAAPPPRLEDRHDAARQRGGRAERAEHARARDHATRS